MSDTPSTAQAILARLPGLHPKKIDLSLGRIERLLAELGHPEQTLPLVVHVAGTNGKGSTVAFLKAMLEAAGRRVHVYTSPHLVRFNERIRLAAPGGGALIGDEELAEVLAHCERVNAGQTISLFEITTAAAFVAFARHPADVLLLEVGLGGRFDATNVLDRPLATVITPVSMDHPEFLGTSVERIAFEKAGILKRGVPAVFAVQDESAMAVLVREADKLGLRPSIGGQDYSARKEGGRLVFEDDHGLLDLPLPRLAGRHQLVNAGTAIATLRLLDPDFSVAAIETGLGAAEWPARLQHLMRGAVPDLVPPGSEVWLDGGHNADGARVLAEAMADAEDRSSRPLILICGMIATKDVDAFLRPFAGLAQDVLAVPVAAEHQGRPAEDVKAMAEAAGLRAVACASIEAALARVRDGCGPVPPRVLITGSLYLAGEVLKLNGTPPA